MRWLFKWVLRLVVLLVVLVVVFVLSLDSILKTLAERQIRSQTGMDVKIGRFSVGILSPVVTIENLKLYNTPEFGGTLFLEIPELHLEYERTALAQHKLHVTLMRFNLAELDVVKNEAGKTNIVSLLTSAGAKQSAGKTGGQTLAKAGIEFTGIDVLNLSLGKLRYVDLKNPRNSRELNLGVKDRVVKNVKSEADLYGVLIVIWLRNGGSLSGMPMFSPPEIIAAPIPGQKAPGTGDAPGAGVLPK